MKDTKGFMEGLMTVLSAVSGGEEVEIEETEGVSARDLRKHWPSLYKEYIVMDTGQSVEAYLKDKNMLDSVIMVIEQQELKEMGNQD